MEKILEKAEEKADAAELYKLKEKHRMIRTTQGKIETSKSVTSNGYGLRIVKDNSTGFSYFSEEKESDKAIKSALKLAKMSERNVEFPLTEEKEDVKIFDEKIKELSSDDLVRVTRRLNRGVERHANALKSQVSTYEIDARVMNSMGTDLSKKETSFFAYAVGKKENSTGSDYYFKKDLAPKVTKIGEEAGELAKRCVGAEPISFTGDIVISPEVFSNFLEQTVLRDVSGKKLEEGQSNWEDKIGEEVCDKIDLVDDPFIDYGVGTTAFDDEGVKTRKTDIIKKGVLKNFLENLETERKSTGNGFRSSFSSTPAVDMTNIVLKPPEREDVFELDEGVYVKELVGMHNMNQSTGDFSLNISTGFKIEDGEKKEPIRGCMLSGNFYNIIKNLEGFHKEDEQKSWFKGPAIRYKGRVIGD